MVVDIILCSVTYLISIKKNIYFLSGSLVNGSGVRTPAFIYNNVCLCQRVMLTETDKKHLIITI